MLKNIKSHLFVLPGLASAAGAVCGAVLSTSTWLWLGIFVAAMLSLVCNWSARVPFMLFLLLCAFNFQGERTAALLPFKKNMRTEITARITAVEHKNARTSLTVSTRRWGNLKLLYPQADSLLARPGDSIYARVVLQPLRTELQVPGNFKLSSWLRRQNLQGQGKIESATISSQTSWLQPVHQARQHVMRTAQHYIPSKTAGLVPALLTGDRSQLDRDISASFKNSGLVHVLAVSGFHVVLIAGLLQILVQNLRLPKNLQRVFASILLIAYMFITGASPSVMRAVIMFVSEQITALMQRRGNSLQRLGLAVTIIIVLNPDAVWDLGLQLSSGATAGILISNLASPLGKLKGFKKVLASSVWISFGATCGTLPILIYNFQNFAPLAWIGNLSVVPLISLAMQSGIFMLATAPFPLVAGVFAATTDTLLSYAVVMAEVLSELPGTRATFGPWPPFLTLILTATFLALPLAWSSTHPKLKIWVAGGLACLGVYHAANYLQGQLFPQVEIIFLDAGQGDCTLLKFSHGKHILIDVGNEANNGNYGAQQLTPFLRRNGIHHLDAVIITHPHADHFGGLTSLLENITVAQIWIPWQARFCDQELWLQALQTIQRQQIPLYDLYAGQKVTGLGPWNLKILHPFIDTPVNPADWNSISIVTQLQYQQRSVALFTGDLGSREENQIMRHALPLQSPILKLGHHGSHYSTSTLWLRQVQPQIAIASAGLHNRYKHPSYKTLARLDSLLIPHLNTAYQGSIWLQIPAVELARNPNSLNFTQVILHE